MNNIIRFIFLILLTSSTILVGQVTTADGSPPTNLIRPDTRVQSDMEAVLLEVYDSKELETINEDIERLLERRERMIFRLARQKYPELAGTLTQRENEERERRTFRKAERQRLKAEREQGRLAENPSNGDEG